MSYPNIIQNHTDDINDLSSQIQTIKSTYLPLSGGTLTGLIRTSHHISKSVDNSYLDIYGGTTHQKGSQLTLHGCEHTPSGLAQITSYDVSGNHCFFRVFPNGKIDTNGNYCHSDTTSRVFFCGGTHTEDGSHLEVTGKDCVGDFGGGAFSLRAKDGTQTASFDGYANGGLYWRGNQVVCLVTHWQSGNKWYRKYSNGWIEQGGIWNTSNTTLSFNIAFTNTNYTIVGSENQGDDNARAIKFNRNNATTTSIRMVGSANPIGVCWYACGF